MTRCSHPVREHILDFDDDFERTLRRKRTQQESNPPSPDPVCEEEKVEEQEKAMTVIFKEVQDMAAKNQTIKELSTSGLDNAMPLCIQYPKAAQDKTDEFELKSSLLHHIPKFHGLSMEDPNKHLKKFEVVCSSMTLVNVDKNILKMKAFPFSLLEKAKDWLYELAPGTVTSWESMKRAFLEKFFPTSRVILLRKRISGIQQNQDGGRDEDAKTKFMQTKKEEAKKDIPETFRKVQVNIPLIDAIKQVPRYAKFLKELCTTRKRILDKKVVKVSENVSAILQRKLPPKCKDSCSFTIPCIIGNNRFQNAMLDLGASINVMPYSVYASMNLGELKNDGVIIELADRSNVYPKGVLEDVLVQVNQLIFPADFYVLDMEDSDRSPTLPILLGKPFMKTDRTKIDMFKGTLTMEFNGEVIDFNISETMRYPSDDHSCFSIDIIDSLVQGYFEDLNDDALETVITRGMKLNNKGAKPMLTYCPHEEFHVVPPCEELLELVIALESLRKHDGKLSNFESIPVSTNKMFPSVIQALTLELKPSPSHLKYVFLGEQETLPIIVSSSLTAQEKEKLVRVLKEFKSTIGWTLADIKEISPTTCMHRIFLKEGANPTREAQHRLNPPMMEVVKKEIIKLLDCGMIYPISDSHWVSLIQVVPKKSGIMVVKNEENELLPTCILTG
ncbi:unnamed protein product [Malus baccata var. baccata]